MATRSFRDAAGIDWSVIQVTPSAGRPGMVRPQFEHGWLLFVSDNGRRRLAPPPPRWFELDEAGLRGLLGASEPSAPARFPMRRLAD